MNSFLARIVDIVSFRKIQTDIVVSQTLVRDEDEVQVINLVSRTSKKRMNEPLLSMIRRFGGKHRAIDKREAYEELLACTWLSYRGR